MVMPASIEKYTRQAERGIRKPKLISVPQEPVEAVEDELTRQLRKLTEMPGVQRRLTELGELSFTPEFLRDAGLELDLAEGSRLRVELGDKGYQFFEVSPSEAEEIPLPKIELPETMIAEGWQVTDEGLLKSSQGELFTPEELEQKRQADLAEFEKIELPKLPEDLQALWGTKQFLPAYQEYAAPILERQENLTQAFSAVFPEVAELGEPVVDAWLDKLNTDDDFQTAFVETLQQKGRTIETENLLKALGADAFQIGELFAQPALGDEFLTSEAIQRYIKGEAEVPTSPEIEAEKSLWDTFYGSLRKGIFQTSQAVNKLMSMTPLPPEAKQMFARNYTEGKVAFDDWVKKHPELEPPAEIKEFKERAGQLPFTEQLGEYIKNPMAMAYTVAEMAPPTLAALGAFAGVTALTGNPLLGGVASFLTFAPMTIESVAQDLISAGAPEDKAYQLALPVGVLISSLDVVGEIPILRALSPALKGFEKGLQKELVNRTMVALFKRGLVTFTTQEFTETLTEVAQQVIQDYTVSFFDKNRDVFANINQTAVQTLIGVAPFAIFGGAVSMTTMRNGKPAKLTDLYDERVEVYKKVGYPTQEAKLQALNDMAKLPEGEAAIKKAHDNIAKTGKTGLPEVPITPAVAPVAAVTAPKIPKTEIGMPEAGIQPSMIEGVVAEEVRPKGKGKIVQISMEEQLKLDQMRREAETPQEQQEVTAYEAQAEVEGLKAWLETEEATRLTNLIKKSGWFKGEVTDITPEQYRDLTGRDAPPSSYVEREQTVTRKAHTTKAGKFIPETTYKVKRKVIPWEYTLDTVATEYGYESSDALKEAIERAGEAQDKIKVLEQEMAAMPLPEPPTKAILLSQGFYNYLTERNVTTLPIKDVDAWMELFGSALTSEDILKQRAATLELRKIEQAKRAANAEEILQEEYLKTGDLEKAAAKAREALKGELPRVTSDILSLITADVRAILLAKVDYHWTQIETEYSFLEENAAIEALTHALTTGDIPRKRGTGTPWFPQGGSQFDRLARVFGRESPILKALEQGKPIEDVVQGVFREHTDPIPVDQKMAEYLRSLPEVPTGKAELLAWQKAWQQPTIEDVRTAQEKQFAIIKLNLDTALAEKRISQDMYDIELAIARNKAYPYTPVTKYDAPIDKAFKIKPMFNFMERSLFNRISKELLWSPLDIGNFFRANKASVDNSFLRQSKLLAGGHPVVAWHGHWAAWQSMFSQKHAEAEWELITRDPDFQIYEQIRVDTGHDPLRVPAFASVKGTEQWRTAEEFGFPTVERAIPRLTQKLPHIKYSERGFSAGTNKIVWGIWKLKLKEARRMQEKVALAEVKLAEGEAVNLIGEMTDTQSMLGDMIQRANLRRFSGLAPAMNALFFAARSKVGRFLLPKHLIGMTIRDGKVGFNRRIMKEAWKDFLITNGEIAGIMFLGSWLGLWDLDDDPRSGEFMSARIGKIRIDPWAGYRQFVVLYARLVTRTGISSVTGAEYDVNPVGALQSFFTNSLAPLASTLLEFWTGRNFLGAVIDYTDKRYWIEKISPFSVQDVWEAFDGEGWKGVAIATVPAIYGEGVQTYTGDWEDNFTKLGLPKYYDNLIYGLKEPYYDVKDFWADTASKFKGVDPATLTERKAYPPFIKAMVEAAGIKDELDSMPNQKLISINANPEKGTTFVQYYETWRAREKLVVAGDKAELTISELQPDGKYKDVKYTGKDAVTAFDKQNPGAVSGNISQRQYALLIEYHSITNPKAQAEFLKQHPELEVNPRTDWLKSNPEANAKLAIWGQADVLTKQAYDIAQGLLNEFDIPDKAIAEYLPPKELADDYFKRVETVEKFGSNSWEDKLIRANNPDLNKWLGLQPVVDSIQALELKAKNRQLQAEYDALTTDEERESFKEAHQDWVDNLRKIDAYGKGDYINETPDEIVKLNVEYGKLVDQWGANSAEAKLIGINNPEFFEWLERQPVTDNKQALELLVKNRVTADEYNLVEDKRQFRIDNAKFADDLRRIEAYQNNGDDNTVELWVEHGRIADKVTGFSAEEKVWLADNPEVHKWALGNKLLTDDGSKWNVPALRITAKWSEQDAEYDALPTDDTSRTDYLVSNEDYRKDRRRREAYQKGFADDLAELFVGYHELPVVGYRQERMLIENPKLADAMGVKVPDRVPSEKYDDLLDKPDKTERDLVMMEGYKAYVPDTFINRYADWVILNRGGAPVGWPVGETWYEDDWWLIEHPAFYQDIYLDQFGLQKRDFSKVPSREVWKKYVDLYLSASTNAKLDVRWNNRDLDKWGQVAFGWTPIEELRRPKPKLTAKERAMEAAREAEEKLKRPK